MDPDHTPVRTMNADHCRASELQVFRDRHGMMGIVDYASKDDMKYALRKLDDTEFKVCSCGRLACQLHPCVSCQPSETQKFRAGTHRHVAHCMQRCVA